MLIDSLSATITMLIALSMATERGVEIVKSLIPWLDQVRTNRVEEGRRRAAVQFLAVVFGILITYMTWPVVAQVVKPGAAPGRDGSTILAIGLLSSGGSAFWNSILGYVLNVKVLKDAEARSAVRGTPIPQPREGQII